MRLFPGSCFIYDRQVVDADVRLDGIIFLAIPFAGFFYEVQIVSEAQFPVWRPFHLVNIVDDNLASDIFTIPEPSLMIVPTISFITLFLSIAPASCVIITGFPAYEARDCLSKTCSGSRSSLRTPPSGNHIQRFP